MGERSIKEPSRVYSTRLFLLTVTPVLSVKSLLNEEMAKWMGSPPLGVCFPPPSPAHNSPRQSQGPPLSFPSPWLSPSQPWSLTAITAWFCGCLPPDPDPQCTRTHARMRTHALKHHTSTSPKWDPRSPASEAPRAILLEIDLQNQNPGPGNLHSSQAALGFLRPARVPHSYYWAGNSKRAGTAISFPAVPPNARNRGDLSQ